MHQRQRTQGIFLDKQDRGEADQIFTIFTEEFGKIDVLGKAIRKITSKLRSGANVFYYSDIEFVQGKRHKTLTDVVVINKFIEINKNSDKTETANKISELIKNFASESEPDPLIWQLLLDVFLKLEIGNWKLEIIHRHFLWNFLSVLGYGPELYKCCVCNKTLLPETLFFSAEEGGVVCWRCFDNNGIGITVETIKALRFWLQNNLQISLKLSFSGEARDNIGEIGELYCNFLQGRVL